MNDCNATSGLRYIADSPSRENGGFHPEAVRAAKEAIETIDHLRALLQRCAKSMEECLDDITSPLRRGAAEMLLEGVRKEVGDG